MHEKRRFERQLGNMAKRFIKFLKSKIFSFPCSGILYRPVFMSFTGQQAVIKEYIFTLFRLCHQKIYTG
jgi:hypothetical protein